MARKQRTDRTETGAPNTLLEAVQYFADADVAHSFVATLRWPDAEVHCPRCDSKRHSFLARRRVWKCLDCKRQFSVKVGTIFEDSPLSLSKWLPAMWMICNCKNGISSYELARAIGVTQKTAWFMLHRIRLAMQSQSFTNKMGGTVEADETYIGAKARNMHKSKLRKAQQMYQTHGPSALGKIAVMGLLERHEGEGKSRVRAFTLKTTRSTELMDHIVRNVERGTTVNTDEARGYGGVISSYTHNVINHAEKYVDGQVHTNGCENFWSLLKRALKGTYVSVEPFHLFRYLDEQCFRFNERTLDDAGRFMLAAASIFGRRVMYKELTGHVVAVS
jgi:transposase-like protein